MDRLKPKIEWSDILDPDKREGLSKEYILTQCLMMWGICKAGNKPHDNFGETISWASEQLGFPATPKNLHKKAQEILNS
jgi:hypothetical protein